MEAHHDVAVLDEAGNVLGRRRIDTGVTGFSELLALLAEHTADPASVPIAIETDKNLIVVALQAAGFAVFAINPRAWPVIGRGTASQGRNPIQATPLYSRTC